MIIDNIHGFFLENVYLYDIKSCHYTILERLNFDTNFINDKENKKSRNVQIGYLMKSDSRIVNLLRLITESLVNEFIIRNNISENDIILKQYDGLIIKKPMNIIDQYIDFGLREIYQKMIISDSRNSFIAINERNEIIIKGVSDRYDLMDNFLKRILLINFMNKKSIFESLQKVKDEIENSDNPELFCIPSVENKYIVYFMKWGPIKISESTMDLLDVEEIDRKKYFKMYIKPFSKSIAKEFIGK